MKYAIIADSSSGDNEVVAAVTNKQIRVHAFFLVASGTVNVKFKSGASTDLTGAMPMVANGQMNPGLWPAAGMFTTAKGESLNINLSAGVAVNGFLLYSEK